MNAKVVCGCDCVMAKAGVDWWQSQKARQYLISAIAQFNETVACRRKDNETGSCKSIFRVLDLLCDGFRARNDADEEPDDLWARGVVECLLGNPSNRLAVYGTLMRGKSNHRVIEGIAGEWRCGFVHGRLYEHYGFPFFVPDAGGDLIPVDVLSSTKLPAAWERIDRFEGVWYNRCLVLVHDSNDEVLFIANIYCKASFSQLQIY